MWGCDRVFYYPDQRIRGTPDAHGLAYEDVFFEAADGVRLHGWFLPAAPGAFDAARGPLGTVVHVHGNAANITGHYEFVRWLPPAGYNLFVFDYRGYGRSGGTISRAGSILDAEAALAYVRARPDVDRSRIFMIGQSLGGAVAIVTAARHPGEIRALIVDGAFSRYRDIVRHHVTHNPLLCFVGWWFPFLVADALDPIEHVAAVAPTPILFMHGGEDRVVPARMGRALYERAREPKELWIIEGADHYQAWDEDGGEARRRVMGFFEKALADQTATADH